MIKVKVIAYNKNDYILIINLIEEFDEYQYTTETNDCYTTVIPLISNLFSIQPCHKTQKLNMYLMKKFIIMQNLFSKIRNYLIFIIEQSI